MQMKASVHTSDTLSSLYLSQQTLCWAIRKCAPTVALVGMVTESGGHRIILLRAAPSGARAVIRLTSSCNCGIVEQWLPQGICRVFSMVVLALGFVWLAT